MPKCRAVRETSLPFFSQKMGSYALLVSGSGVEASDGRLDGHAPSTRHGRTDDGAALPEPGRAPHGGDRGADSGVSPAQDHGRERVLPPLGHAVLCPPSPRPPPPAG